MIDGPVLVLNQSYEPLHVCRVRRAVVLVYQKKAEMLENGYGYVHSANSLFPIPSVIRLASMIKRPHRSSKKLTRMEVFRRDHFTCQYCGKHTHQLTIDHVKPRSQEGPHKWENVVSACVPCNRKKAGRTPEEAGMRLLTRPVQPRDNGLFYIPTNYSNPRHEWQKYLLQ
jgi:5-methylcytosine-specific restriction endonuclease McrA